MKILFDTSIPYAFAHGGVEIQIEALKRGLEALGEEVDYLRWWDPNQNGNVVHFFGRPTSGFVRLAQAKGMKVVVTEFLGELGSRPAWKRWIQTTGLKVASLFLPPQWRAHLPDQLYRRIDAGMAITTWEAKLMRTVYGAAKEKLFVIPAAVEPTFLAGSVLPRERWLLYVATITERKRSNEVARAACLAGTPVWFIGKPYDTRDPYFKDFEEIVKKSGGLLRYEGSLENREALAKAYREARGFVLLSAHETLSLAALEAAGCGCRLLLPDLPWAHSYFGDTAAYCPPFSSEGELALQLRKFYDAAPTLPLPRPPITWAEAATRLQALYRRL